MRGQTYCLIGALISLLIFFFVGESVGILFAILLVVDSTIQGYCGILSKLDEINIKK